MKKLLLPLLIASALLSITNVSNAATAAETATYLAATEQADAKYKVDAEKCKPLMDNAKDVCVKEAKAARVHTEATAKAAYKNTMSASVTARKDIADADYEVAKEKCDDQKGNAKDVCVKEAKAAKVTAMEDAKADKKVVAARTDATEDKRTAEYKVAAEKCDAMAGAAKSTCIAAAKTKYAQ